MLAALAADAAAAAGLLLDLLLALAALAVLTPLLGALTYSAAAYAGTRSREPRRRGAPSERSAAAMCVFVLKGFGLALLLGVLLRHCGTLIAACAGAGVLLLAQAQQDEMVQLLASNNPWDILFLYVLLPCLCAPTHLTHGIGAAWLIYLCLAYIWVKSAHASADFLMSSAAMSCGFFYAAWFGGLFLHLQEIKMGDAFMVGFGTAVLHICPISVDLCIVLIALARAGSPRELLAMLTTNTTKTL